MVTQCAFFLHRNPENVQKDHHHHLHEWPRLLDHRSFGSAAAYHDRRQTPFIGSTTCCSVLVFGRSSDDSESAFSCVCSTYIIYEKSIRWGMNPHSDIIIHIANHAKNTRRKFEQWRKLAIQMRVEANPPSKKSY